MIEKMIMPRFRKLIAESSWILFGQLGSLLCSFLFIRLLTERIEPVEYGRLALGLTLYTLLTQIITGIPSAGAGRLYATAKQQEDLDAFYHACKKMLVLCNLVTIGFILFLVLINESLIDWPYSGLFLAIAVYAICNNYYSIINTLENASRNRKRVAIYTILEVLLRTFIVLSIISLFGQGSTAIVIGFAIASAVTFLCQMAFSRDKFKALQRSSTKGSINNWTTLMWHYSWPIAVGGLFNWSYYASHRWSLETFTTTADVGKFYLLTQIGYAPISAVGACLISFVMPIMYSRAEGKNNNLLINSSYVLLKKIIFYLALFLTLITTFAFLFSAQIFKILTTTAYQDVATFLPVIVLAAGVLKISHLLGVAVEVKKATRYFVVRDTLGNLIIASVNIASTYYWGLQGLVFSILGGALIHLIWQYFIVRKVLRSG